MRKTVLTIEQMKHLEKLGMNTSDASMYYVYDDMYGTFYLMINEESGTEDSILNDCYIYAYTLTDVLDKIPVILDDECLANEYPIIMKRYDAVSDKAYYLTSYYNDNVDGIMETFITKSDPLDSAYELLLYCIEKKYIELNK